MNNLKDKLLEQVYWQVHGQVLEQVHGQVQRQVDKKIYMQASRQVRWRILEPLQNTMNRLWTRNP